MRVGKQMQFFAARVNSAKALLYAINGGRDEMTGMQVIDKGVIEPITPEADGTLDYEKVKNNYEKALEWLSETYVMALNIIHYMHDKYAYESIEMALHDKEVYRTLGCGMSGLSIAADSSPPSSTPRSTRSTTRTRRPWKATSTSTLRAPTTT